MSLFNGVQPPTLESLRKHAVNERGVLSVVSEPLWDYATYPQAGTTSLDFFQNAVGQGGKTEEDTNMPGNGVLPSPQMMMVTGIAVEFFPAALPGRVGAADLNSNWNDLYEVYQTGYLQFKVGEYFPLQQGPLGMFPPTFRLGGAAAVTGTPGASNEIDRVDYAVVTGIPFPIVPVSIPETQNFRVSLKWNTAVGITADAVIGVRLFGYRYKAVQG